MVDEKGEIKYTSIINGQTYRVIATKRGGGNSIWSARDTIKNENSGRVKEMSRKEWYNLFKKWQ